MNTNTPTDMRKCGIQISCLCFRLKRYAGGKEALEAELYSRFVLVLNEKKAKIRSLQETLTQLQETRYRLLILTNMT